MSDDKVRLNVGGKLFVTSTTTLANAGRSSMLGAMIDENWQSRSDELFIDRNPSYFSVLLDLLRTSELHIPPGMSERALYREALFYGILDHVRAAKWGPLDGNRLECVVSIRGRATGDGTAIRAAQDGGCCVAHGSMVHVYDWTMEEQFPLTLDYVNVNDVGFLNPQRVVICTCERGENAGGMAVFNVKRGNMEHKFQAFHNGQPKNFTARAMTSIDSYVFASCRGKSYEDGIGCWDQVTGKQVSFFYETPVCPLGYASKLQWLPQSNLLLAATLYPHNANIEDSFIGLLDSRSKDVVWSWMESEEASVTDTHLILDAIAMEECSTVCVVDQWDTMGFIDMRNSNQVVRWKERYKPRKCIEVGEHCHSKLAVWGSQLFCSKNDSVYVFCRPDWDATRSVETARLRKSQGGPISDMAVGADRLFVLHNEEDVFDVWETPSTSGIVDDL